MDIPPEVLEVLKCSSCELYLSQGPVYLQHDGAAVCGRCYTPKRPAARNTQYEATARLLKFPCKNREFGCLETVPYVGQNEVIGHEEVCEHRQYACPLLGCTWLGLKMDVLAHCRDQHLDSVLENPCSLTHDITKSSVRTYLLRAFQLLFLLHAKVCLVSGKLFHSVRLLGASDETTKYFYSLVIKRGEEQVTKKGLVASQGCLTIQEPTSLALNTNSLLDLLGGFDGTTFTVTVSDAAKQLTSELKRKVSDDDQHSSEVKRKMSDVKCAKCPMLVTVFRYRDENGWQCENCAPDTRICNNGSCMYTDTENKCRKHELCYCEQRPRCHICNARVTRVSLLKHYESKHQDITHMSGSTWRATQTGKFCLLTNVAGTVMCKYKVQDTHFKLDINIPVTSSQLREFSCKVRVTDSDTGYVRTFTPNAMYDKVYDWRIRVEELEFPLCNEFDVCVDIQKIKL